MIAIWHGHGRPMRSAVWKGAEKRAAPLTLSTGKYGFSLGFWTSVTIIPCSERLAHGAFWRTTSPCTAKSSPAPAQNVVASGSPASGFRRNVPSSNWAQNFALLASKCFLSNWASSKTHPGAKRAAETPAALMASVATPHFIPPPPYVFRPKTSIPA